jgi:hypothetical protein
MSPQELDRQALYYAADKMKSSPDGIFHAQHLKQAYLDGYNAAMKDLLVGMSLNPIAQQTVQSVPTTQTLQQSNLSNLSNL